MKTNDELKEMMNLAGDYAAHMLGSGVHLSRVVRCTQRICEPNGFHVSMATFQRSIIMTLSDEKNHRNAYTEVVEIPHLPISFELNSDLSALSWKAHDKNLSLDILKNLYGKLIHKPHINNILVLLLTGAANASFCELFGGDWFAMAIVFSATLIGMFTKQELLKKGVNTFIVFVLCAFIASLYACSSLLFNTTPDIAIGTSVLFLIPGVPLLNGVIDVMDGHVLVGCTRLINSFLLVLCIGIGLSLTLWIVKNYLI